MRKQLKSTPVKSHKTTELHHWTFQVLIKYFLLNKRPMPLLRPRLMSKFENVA